MLTADNATTAPAVARRLPMAEILLSPISGAAAMALSSVGIIGDALRLLAE